MSRRKYWLLAVGVAVTWSLVLYRLWLLEPRLVSRLVVLVLAAGAGWLALRRIRRDRTASIKTLVFVLPVGIALACLPLRIVLQHREIRDALARAGAEDYVLEANGMWGSMLESSAGNVLGNAYAAYATTQLVTLDLQLETADLSALYSLPSQELRLVTIKRQSKGVALSPELIEWINRSHHQPLVTIALHNPSQAEIDCLRDLKGESSVNFSQLSARNLRIDIPSAFDFSISDSDLSATDAFRQIDLPRATRWQLIGCPLGESELLLNAISRTQELSVIDTALTQSIANRLIRMDVRDLTLGDLQFPKDMQWTKDTSRQANSLFLWGSNLNGQQVLEMLRQRSCRFVYINLDSEFSPAEIAALMRLPRIVSLRLTGSWITPIHLQSMSSLDRSLRLSILDSSLAPEQVKRLNQTAAAGVKLFVNELSH